MRCKILIRSLLLLIITFFLASCAAMPSTVSRPSLSYMSPTLKELQQLPPPKGKLIAAVYGFRDQTGQYKPSNGGTNFSTAVTQGGAAILVQTLKKSNWFLPVERENLNNLLTERKIYRAARERLKQSNSAPNNTGNGTSTMQSGATGSASAPAGGMRSSGATSSNTASAPVINIEPPALLPAAVVIDGGIVGYDTNTLTGGAGANYYGAGGSANFQQDKVTVVLRAINVETGEVLDSVSVTKTILSQVVDFSLFRFVSYSRLLQVETGFSANEPVQQCVQEAIEKAVIALIVDGISAGHWALQDLKDMNNPVIRSYLEERGYSYINPTRQGAQPPAVKSPNARTPGLAGGQS